MFGWRKKKIATLLNLSDFSDGKILILFVHGLGGDQTTWKYFQELLVNESELNKYIDITFYNYPTGIFPNPFKKYPTLYDVAEGLKSFIDVHCDKYKNIIFVGHSMGGLVIRQYVLDEIISLRGEKIRSIILYATPNKGSDIANYAKSIYLANKHVRTLNRNSDFFRHLEKYWHLYSINGRIEMMCVCAGIDKLVDQESARMYWGNFSFEVDISKTHKNIIRAKNAEDLSYTILIREIKKIIKKIELEAEENILRDNDIPDDNEDLDYQ